MTLALPVQPAPPANQGPSTGAGPARADRTPVRALLFYILGILAALPCLLFLATERYTPLARMLAWAGLALSLLPTVVMLAWPRSRRNSLAAVGLNVALFYHLAPLHERTLQLRWGPARISDESIETALFLAAMAVPALWLGWTLMGLLPRRAFPRLRLELPTSRLRWTGYLVVSWSLLADVLWLSGQLTTYQPVVSVISVLAPLELGLALLLVLQQRGEATFRDRMLFLGLFGLCGAIGLARGVLLAIIRPFLIYILGWLYLSRRMRVVPLLLAIFVVLIMQPVKGEFRQRVWDRQIDISITDRALLYVDLMDQHWLGHSDDPAPDETRDRSVQEAAARTGASLALANVMELTPATVPHQWGATLQYMRYALVPRVLYPDKPIAQYADVWAAVMYGYCSTRASAHVMVGLSQIAESYINFGLLGGLLWLMLTGALYRLLDEIFGHKDAGSGGLALYIYMVLAVMINSEGSFAQFFGGVLQVLIFYGLVLGVLGMKARGRVPR